MSTIPPEPPQGKPAKKRRGRQTNAMKEHVRALMLKGYTHMQISKHTGLKLPLLSQWSKKWGYGPAAECEKRKLIKGELKPPTEEPLIDVPAPKKTATPAPASVLDALDVYQRKLERDIVTADDPTDNMDRLVVLGLLQQVREFMGNLPPIENYADLTRILNILKEKRGEKKTNPDSRAANLSILTSKPMKPTVEPEPEPDPEPDPDDEYQDAPDSDPGD